MEKINRLTTSAIIIAKKVWRRMRISTAWTMRDIELDSAIERIFRFLEMLIVISLLGVAFRIVDPFTGSIVIVILSFAAGAYVSLPFSRFYLKIAERRVRKDKQIMDNIRSRKYIKISTWRFFIIMLFALTTTAIMIRLQILIGSTVQLDENRVRAVYREQMKQQAYADCIYGAARTAQPLSLCQHLDPKRTVPSVDPPVKSSRPN